MYTQTHAYAGCSKQWGKAGNNLILYCTTSTEPENIKWRGRWGNWMHGEHMWLGFETLSLEI